MSARNAGFIACLVGVLVMVTGRFVAGAPHWLIYVGVGVIALGWVLLGSSMFGRKRKANG